jgi:mannose-6-phosphate isomerase-like protein (cupin superfamily)
MNRFAVAYAAVATPLVAFVAWTVVQRARAETPPPTAAAPLDATGQRAYLIPAGAGRISNPGEWKFTAAQGSGAYSMVELEAKELPRLPPGSGHIHTREDESWYVIEGELLFDVGDQQLTAKPGSLVYAPRNVPHGYRVTKVPARWLIIFTPAGIEPLFAEVGELRKRFPNQDGEYREELEKLQAKYGARPAKGWKRPSESTPR